MITGDPERALRNLLEHDQMFTELLCEEKKRLGLPAIEIDTTGCDSLSWPHCDGLKWLHVDDASMAL
jgi:hypothetical protein